MNPTQQEQLLNVGAYLQTIRQEKGKTVDEVANKIFIRPALVRAIETGDWETLPEPVFVQGFIRRYADHLGLDGREVSQRFEPTPVAVLPNPELARSGAVEGVVKQQDKYGLKVLSKAEPPQNGNGNAAPRTPTSARPAGGMKWLGGIGLAALVGLVLWLATRPAPQQAASPEVDTEEAAAETETEDTAAVETAEETVPPPVDGDATGEQSETAIADPAAPVTFAINLEGEAWMRVIVDGAEVYEGILPAGTQESWTAENQLSVTAGNSGSVLYSFNGSEEIPLGAPGSVTSLTLTPDTDPESLPTQ